MVGSSAAGQTSNQWLKIGFGQNTPYSIGAVVVDPGATHGHPTSNDLKDFQIRVSTTGTDDADFTTVFSGTAKKSHQLQRFVFPQAVSARYIELFAVDNYGGTGSIDVAEFEAVAFGVPITLPVPSLTSSPCSEKSGRLHPGAARSHQRYAGSKQRGSTDPQPHADPRH